MIGILRWFITSQWIHIPHLSKPGGREALLTDRLVPTKTESVSESIDKITGDFLRLQLFYARQNSENCPEKTAYRRTTKPREHSGGGEGGVYSVWRKRQPRRHRQRGRGGSGNSLSPLSYPRRIDRSGLSN